MIIENKILYNKHNIFESRVQAGKLLAKLIEQEQIDVFMIIPNGGLPVGYGFITEYTQEKPLIDLLIVKKIHVPWSTEAGMGAITPSGDIFLNHSMVSHYEIKDDKIQNQITKTKQRIQQIKDRFGITKTANLEEKSILLLDDGIASGFSMLAGASWLKEKKAKKIIIGAPTAPLSSLRILEPKVDKIFCVNICEGFSFAVADAYQHWYDLTLEEAIDYYKKTVKIIGDY